MLELKSESGNRYAIEYKNDAIMVNGVAYSPDIAQISGTNFHLLLDNKSFNVIIQYDKDCNDITLEVNGNRYAINIKDQYALLLEELGMANIYANAAENIKAPMPGLVVSIHAAAGDILKKGDQLLVLEAMKMENVIKAPSDVTIDKILVKPKDTVEKGQLLISFKV